MVTFKPLVYQAEFIGPHLLESITKGLYTDPKHVIREYVQNAIEADPPSSTVKVHIREGEISVLDDGGGMNEEMIIEALKIGFSKKDPRRHFGFRGIGIWSGVAVCDTILISTKRKSERKEYIVKINAKGIREEYERKVKPLTQVLTENVEIGEIDATPEKHGTHVRLINILEEAKSLLSLDDVRRYMRFSLPAKFSSAFPFRKKIEIELGGNVPYYKSAEIFLNDEPIYRPPFIGNLEGPYTLPIKIGGQKFAFVWYCVHKENKAIPDPESRGLVYKKFGFTIGDEARSIFDWWETSRGLFNWCVGEIHIIHQDIKPNSERTDLENSEEKSLLTQRLKGIASEIEDKSRLQSFFINLYDRIREMNLMLEEPTFSSEEEKDECIYELRRLVNLMQGDLQKRKYMQYIRERDKNRLVRAIERGKKLIEKYKRIPVTPEVGIKKEKIPAEIPAPKIEVKELPPTPSFSDLLDLDKFGSETKTVLTSVEMILDEYFSKDPTISSEIKRRIAEKIKKFHDKYAICNYT
jgi:molecular chaperone HtpG